MERRLTGLDSAFLAVETHAAHMHMTAVVTPEPSDETAATFETVRDHLGPRLCALPVFRRSLQEVPLGLDHPVWVEQEVDLAAHLHHMAIPSPGSQAELEELVGHLSALPLDRNRPLWNMCFVEGLDRGRAALITKVHHALLDGVAGAEVFGRLFDVDSGASSRPPGAATNAPARPLSNATLLRRAARSLARAPFEVAGQAISSASTFTRRIWGRPGSDAEREPLAPASFSAPESALNGSITARREVTFGSVSLTEAQGLKRAFGVKLNDIALELCAGTLRRYLRDQKEYPKEALVAMIPVSVAADSEDRTSGNRVSAMTVELPVHRADPVSRLSNIQRGMLRAKRAHRALGGDLLSGWADVAPPIVLSGLSEIYSRLNLADQHRPLVNLIMSNIAGPDISLYCAGHRVEACYPLGPIYEGCALNVTVMSYDGRLHFGWIACPDVVPGVDRLQGYLSESLTELRSEAEMRERPSQPRRTPGGSDRKLPPERPGPRLPAIG